MLIKDTQVLLPSPGTKNQARKWTPQLKLIMASTHLYEVHHSYPHLLLQDKQEGKYRHSTGEDRNHSPPSEGGQGGGGGYVEYWDLVRPFPPL